MGNRFPFGANRTANDGARTATHGIAMARTGNGFPCDMIRIAWLRNGFPCDVIRTAWLRNGFPATRSPSSWTTTFARGWESVSHVRRSERRSAVPALVLAEKLARRGKPFPIPRKKPDAHTQTPCPPGPPSSLR